MIYPRFQNIPLFNHLTDHEIDWLFEKSECLEKGKHELIFPAGKKDDSVYLLLNGIVKLETYSSNSEKMVIKAMIQPYSIFGVEAILKNEKFNKSAFSFSESVKFLRFPVSCFNHLMQNNTAFAFAIFEHIGGKLYQMEQRVEACILKSPKERMIDFIKLQMDKQDIVTQNEPILLRHNYTQFEMAGLLGMAPQTVHGLLKKLENLQWIQFGRKEIIVTNKAALLAA